MNKSKDFLIRFFIIYLYLYVILFIFVQTSPVNAFTALESELVHGRSVENVIILNNYSYEISPSCIGIVSLAMLVGLTFAPQKLKVKNKIKIIGFGGAILIGFNILRVFYSIYLGSIGGPQIAQLTHTISWFVMGGMVLFVWYLLVKIVERPKQIVDIF